MRFFYSGGTVGMHISVNGKMELVCAGTVADYIGHEGLNPKSLVVEYNGRVIAADHWACTVLSEGDQLELLSFVAGG
jgi:thiamine biosynthesis protein ThiS